MPRRPRHRVVPHLHYDDPLAAIAWLCRVFGFTEVRRYDRGEDNVTARLKGPDGGAVMLSGHDDDFSDWMRERAPRFEQATGRSWPLLTHQWEFATPTASGPEAAAVADGAVQDREASS